MFYNVPANISSNLKVLNTFTKCVRKLLRLNCCVLPNFGTRTYKCLNFNVLSKLTDVLQHLKVLKEDTRQCCIHRVYKSDYKTTTKFFGI